MSPTVSGGQMRVDYPASACVQARSFRPIPWRMLQRESSCSASACRRRRARVPVPPASPGTRDPPGGARTVLRLRPLTRRRGTRALTSSDENAPSRACARRESARVRTCRSLRSAPWAPLDCPCEPLAESRCRVVPGSPVVRWKWSPAWPVVTSAYIELPRHYSWLPHCSTS